MPNHPTYPIGSYVRMLKDVTWGGFTFNKGEKYLIVEGGKNQHRPRVRAVGPDLTYKDWYLEHGQVEKVIDIDHEQYFYDLVVGDNIGVHTETIEDAKKLLTWAHIQGLRWQGDESFLNFSFISKGLPIYYLKNGTRGSLDSALRSTRITIVNFSQHKNRI